MRDSSIILQTKKLVQVKIKRKFIKKIKRRIEINKGRKINKKKKKKSEHLICIRETIGTSLCVSVLRERN